jgi:hypothetical protein
LHAAEANVNVEGQFAPIALFVFNRVHHTQMCLEALVENEGFAESRLFIFSDGPRSEAERVAVEGVRRVVRSFELPNANAGLAKSIMAGVSELVARFGKVIVLEDDLVTSQYFLRFMNTGIRRYADTEQVFQIAGYIPPIECPPTGTDAVFLPFSTSWGWATWKRAWDRFAKDPHDGFERLRRSRELRRRFDLDGAYYWLLRRSMRGRGDSWAIHWYLTIFLSQGLVLFPVRSLVTNIGFDDSGVHRGRIKGDSATANLESHRPLERMPSGLAVDPDVYVLVRARIRSSHPAWYRLLACH